MSKNKGVLVSGEELVDFPEKQPHRPVKNVKMLLINQVSGYIDNLVKAGISYGKISKRIGINKGQIQMLHKKTWWPKTIRSQNKILEAIYGG